MSVKHIGVLIVVVLTMVNVGVGWGALLYVAAVVKTVLSIEFRTGEYDDEEDDDEDEDDEGDEDAS